MRYAKGLVMALGWAAEAFEALGSWREDALLEYRKHRDHYLKVVREPGAGDDPNAGPPSGGQGSRWCWS